MIAALFFANTETATASRDCKEARLDDPGGTMEKFPIFDQDSLDICDGMIAAQLADAYRLAKSPDAKPRFTSGLLASTDAASDAGKEAVGFGNVKASVTAIFRHGACAHDFISARFGAYSPKAFLEELTAFHQILRENALEPAPPPFLSSHALHCYLGTRGLGPTDSAVEGLLRTTATLPFLQQVLHQACLDHALPLPPAPRTIPVVGKRIPVRATRLAKFKATLDERLRDRHSQPLGIALCQEILYEGITTLGSSGQAESACHPHAALVIGRKRGPRGTCQLLVRNSFGESCNGYADWECDKRSGGGQVWVDEKKLLENTLTLYYLR